MGLIYSYFLGYGRTDDPDPTTGLTSRDKYVLKNTWKEAQADPVKLGTGLLVEFLEQYPEYIQMFPFRNLPKDKFAQDKKFQAHCANIVFALNSFVSSLDNPDLLVELLKKSGESHGKRNTPAKAYRELKPIAMKHLEANAPKSFTSEAKVTWDKALDVVFNTIISGLTQKN